MNIDGSQKIIKKSKSKASRHLHVVDNISNASKRLMKQINAPSDSSNASIGKTPSAANLLQLHA